MHIETLASLTGYQAFTKKEDLLVYEKIIFTVKEDGQPTLWDHFGKVPKTGEAWSAKLPQDSPCTIMFDTQTIEGTLSEVSASCKVSDDGPTTTYRFAMTRQLDQGTANSLIHPYFNARKVEEVEKPKTQWSKGGITTKIVPIQYAFTLNMDA